MSEFSWSAGRYELSDDTGIQIQVFWVGASEASRVYDNQKTKKNIMPDIMIIEPGHVAHIINKRSKLRKPSYMLQTCTASLWF